MLKITSVLIGVIILIGPAHAETDMRSGMFMLPHCKVILDERAPRTMLSGVCLGTVNTLKVMGGMFVDDAKICGPDISPGQGVRVVVKFLEENPKVLHRDFTLLASMALQRAWPCEKE